MQAADFRALALALPGVEERDHLGAPSFRVAGKIFAQLADAQTTGLVKLSPAEQDALRASDPERFWVPSHWSQFGWTYVRLAGTDPAQLRGLLERSWSLVAPKKLVATTPARLRERFGGLQTNTWLVSHSMGAPPLAAKAALARYWDAWADRGPESWPQWLDTARTIADGIGAIIGAPAGSISLVPNVALSQAAIASSVTFTARRNEVVYEALQFPSLTYVWKAWERFGAVTRPVPTDDGMTIPTQRIVDAIGEHTAVVVLSHAYYQSGALIDVPTIVAQAKRMGALVVLDTYQTTGIVPYDVGELGVDIVVGGSHKWLCGGPGCAFMYVAPACAAAFEPAVTGWFGHADPFAFEPAPIRYARDAMHWATGTPTIPGYLVAQAGHELIREVGVPAIREHNIRLTTKIAQAALGRGLRIKSPLDPLARTGWIGIDVPDGARIVDELVARRVIVDYRPGCGIRVSPHFYTTDDEIDCFFTELDRLVR